MILSDLKHRYDIGEYLSSVRLNYKIVEVGVAYGQNAKLILDKWDGDKLYLVDPYVKQDISQYASNMENVDFDAMLKWATEHLEPHKGRFEFVRRFSNDALSYFDDRSLDMVYLDGNHQNPVFENDFKGWIEKIKVGGIFGGHDYMDIDTPSYKCDVKSTVDDYVYHNAFDLHLTNDDDGVKSWWIQL
jgi:hypothetical protein